MNTTLTPVSELNHSCIRGVCPADCDAYKNELPPDLQPTAEKCLSTQNCHWPACPCYPGVAQQPEPVANVCQHPMACRFPGCTEC